MSCPICWQPCTANDGHACCAAGPCMAELPLQLLLCLHVLIALAKVSSFCPCVHPDQTRVGLQVADPKNPVKSTEQREQVTFTGPSGFSVPQSKGLCGAGCGHRSAHRLRVSLPCGRDAGDLQPAVHGSRVRAQSPPGRSLGGNSCGLNEVLTAAPWSSAVFMCSCWRFRQLARYLPCRNGRACQLKGTVPAACCM